VVPRRHGRSRHDRTVAPGAARQGRPVKRLLDLYCGAGGAAEGYHRAGFDEIWGIDVKPQPHYPYNFIEDDALDVLSTLAWEGCYLLPPGQRDKHRYIFLSEIDAIHASPPCQRYSKALNCRPGLRDTYPDLIPPTREELEEIGLPYVIENVPGAPLIDPLVLCGCHFDMTTEYKGQKVGLKRPRWFEANFPVPSPGPHEHDYKAVPIFGHSAGGNYPLFRGPGFATFAREIMGIEWMNRDELGESIPPRFTEYVGMFLLAEAYGYRTAAPA
jgi:DNA (cytosine-5)-methyltransferase 1